MSKPTDEDKATAREVLSTEWLRVPTGVSRRLEKRIAALLAADRDRAVEVAHQMFKDHVCGQPIPKPREIRVRLESPVTE